MSKNGDKLKCKKWNTPHTDISFQLIIPFPLSDFHLLDDACQMHAGVHKTQLNSQIFSGSSNNGKYRLPWHHKREKCYSGNVYTGRSNLHGIILLHSTSHGVSNLIRSVGTCGRLKWSLPAVLETPSVRKNWIGPKEHSPLHSGPLQYCWASNMTEWIGTLAECSL